MRGPIDYIIVGFEGNKFDGSIVNAIAEAVDQGIIALISLAVVVKDAEGEVTSIDLNRTDSGEYVLDLSIELPEELAPVDQADVDEIGELLENDTAAGMLVIEHLWAIPLKQALTKSGGVLVAEGRIHPEAALELSKV